MSQATTPTTEGHGKFLFFSLYIFFRARLYYFPFFLFNFNPPRRRVALHIYS